MVHDRQQDTRAALSTLLLRYFTTTRRQHSKLETRGKAQRVARPALQNSGVTGPEFTKFFSRRRGVIGGVNVRIHLWSSGRYGMPAHSERWGMPIFAD